MKTLLIALLVTFLFIFSTSVPTYGQDGDEPVIPPFIPPEFPKDDLRFQHLTTEDGLSEGRVWGITQDRQGFMWFTSWDGLNRYDGYEFKVYKEEYGNPNSPGGEGFWRVYEDQEGMIWAASMTGGGLSKFDPTKEQWHRFQHDPDDIQSLSSNNVYDIHEDRQGVLWVGTEGGGINRFEGETEEGVARFTRFPTDPYDLSGTSSDFVPTIYEDNSGELWFCTWGGLNHYNRETETFIHYQHDPDDPASLSSDQVYTAYEDSSGELWVGTYGGGLNRFDRGTETFTHYQHDPDDPHSISGDTITSILEDGSGVLWIGTWDGGLNRYDRETDTFLSYQHDPSDTRSLGNNTVTALFEDQSGILWIGTAGGGIDRLAPFGQTFGLIRNKPADLNSLGNNDVRAVLEDRSGDWWMGTWGGGLNHYDQETELFRQYLHDPDDPGSPSDNHVLSLLEDRAGVLWIGFDNGGLNRLDSRTGDGKTTHFTRFEHDPADPQSLSGYAVTSIYEDSAGILWVGTWAGGLNSFDGQTEDGQARFRRYQHDIEDPHSLGRGTVWSIHEDPAKVLWVGTAGGGLCRYSKESETFVCYEHDPEDDQSLSSNTVWAIYQDGDGLLWLGTSAGLNRFDPQTGEFAHYTKADGLPHDTVVGILKEDTSQDDGSGVLWLATLGGLSRFDPKLGTFINYNAGDGLQGDIFNPAVSKSGSGMMLFGGQQGLNYFYPEDVQENPSIPPVRVTDFRLSNEPVSLGDDSPLQKSIVETDHLVLSHEDRVISFEFVALDYASPEKNRYRYKLEGFDEEWIEVGSDRRFVTYTNLDPGDYVFRVIGSNNDGVWNEDGASINLTITPPWWQAFWFQGGLILLIAGLVVGSFVWQRKSAHIREKELRYQIEERSQQLVFAQGQVEALFNASQVGIALTTYSGKIVAANETLRKMADYPSLEEFLQRNATEFYADPGQREEMLEQISKTGSAQMYGIELRTRDGNPLYAIMSGSEVQRQGDKFLLTVVDDVTDQVQLRNQLQEEVADRRIAEKELQLQISLVDRLLDVAVDTIEIIDADTLDYVKFNDAISRITGYSNEEIAKMNSVTDFYDEADQLRLETAIERVYNTGRGIERASLIGKDGSRTPMEYTGAVIKDEEGNPRYLVAIGRDITERKRAEEQLRFQGRLLETVGQSVIVTDLEGHVVYWNLAAERLFGWTAEEAVGRLTSELMVDAYDQEPIPEVRAHFLAGKSWTGEFPVYHRDGTPLNIETTITPVFNENGELSHTIGVSQDVSERKQAREALQKSEEAYRGLVEKINDVIYAIDLDGVITYLNPAVESLIGLPPEQVIGQPFAQYIHPEDLGKMQDSVQSLFSGEAPGPAEYRVMDTSGEIRWIRVTSQPVTDGDRVTGLQGVLSDISERKKLDERREEEATLAERARLARMLHDAVTQTLFSASVIAEATPRVWLKDPTQAHRNMDQLTAMLRGAMAEMRSMIIELSPSATSGKTLGELLQTLVEANQPRTNYPVSLVVEGDNILPEAVTIGFYRVAQEALHNVVQHAEATEAGIKVVIDQEGAFLSIHDNGRGFDQNASPAGHFGLSIMRERLREIGGNLVIESQPGAGTQVIASWSDESNGEES